MNSRLRMLFVISVALVLVLSPGEGFPVGRAERQAFPEGENPSKLSQSIDKRLAMDFLRRLSGAVMGAKSRFTRSDSVTDDGLHAEDVDYVLLEEVLNEYLEKHGGVWDRELEDDEYDIVAENYEKHIREGEGKKKDKDQAVNGTLTAQHESEMNATVRASTERFGRQTQRTSDVDTTKRISDVGKPGSTTRAFFPVLWTTRSSTRQQSLRNISTAFGDQKPTTPFLATKTPTEYPGKLFTTKSTADGHATDTERWWVTPRTTGIPPGGVRESLSWKVDSKGGHQVHVVVYFD